VRPLFGAGADVRFSGEEVYGRCLDLHSFYNTYMNLEVARDERQRALAAGSASSAELRYLSYLSSFHMFGASRTGKDLHYKQCVPARTRPLPRYQLSVALTLFSLLGRYLQELHDYLLSFYRRTQPLSDLDSILERIDQEFERKFADGSLVKEWSSNDNRHNHTTNGSDASASSSSSSSMETEGAVVAPASTGGANSGIYCQACKKSFTKESLYTSHLSGKKHKRAAQRLSSTDSRSDTDLPEEMRSIKHLESGERQIWALEYRVHRFGEMLSENIENTKVNIEKKLARTPEELEADFHDDPDDEEDAADDDDPSQDVRSTYYPCCHEAFTRASFSPIYIVITSWNPKLSCWLGRKAHSLLVVQTSRPWVCWWRHCAGSSIQLSRSRARCLVTLTLGMLSVEYKCEICGNTSYWGRRAFEKHFQEARHAQGMRILGIPNTLHFQEITKINDAIERTPESYLNARLCVVVHSHPTRRHLLSSVEEDQRRHGQAQVARRRRGGIRGLGGPTAQQEDLLGSQASGPAVERRPRVRVGVLGRLSRCSKRPLYLLLTSFAINPIHWRSRWLVRCREAEWLLLLLLLQFLGGTRQLLLPLLWSCCVWQIVIIVVVVLGVFASLKHLGFFMILVVLVVLVAVARSAGRLGGGCCPCGSGGPRLRVCFSVSKEAFVDNVSQALDHSHILLSYDAFQQLRAMPSPQSDARPESGGCHLDVPVAAGPGSSRQRRSAAVARTQSESALDAATERALLTYRWGARHCHRRAVGGRVRVVVAALGAPLAATRSAEELAALARSRRAHARCRCRRRCCSSDGLACLLLRHLLGLLLHRCRGCCSRDVDRRGVAREACKIARDRCQRLCELAWFGRHGVGTSGGLMMMVVLLLHQQLGAEQRLFVLQVVRVRVVLVVFALARILLCTHAAARRGAGAGGSTAAGGGVGVGEAREALAALLDPSAQLLGRLGDDGSLGGRRRGPPPSRVVAAARGIRCPGAASAPWSARSRRGGIRRLHQGRRHQPRRRRQQPSWRQVLLLLLLLLCLLHHGM